MGKMRAVFAPAGANRTQSKVKHDCSNPPEWSSLFALSDNPGFYWKSWRFVGSKAVRVATKNSTY
jgi:hypothetical protein